MEYVSGTIEDIVYSDEESGFAVARLKARSKELGPTCIVGTFTTLRAGETITCSGKWNHHPKHGRQFAVDSYELKAPKDLVGIQKYLESGLIKGIGPTYAKRIVETFGLQTLSVIDSQPDRLVEVEGIGQRRIDQIKQHWGDQKSVREVMIFLRSNGVGTALAQKIYKRYGENSISVMKEDPYRLARELFGVGFQTADKIADQMGIPHDSPQRVIAGLEYVLRQLSEQGHACYPEETFIEHAEKILGVDQALFHKGIVTLELEERLFRKELSTEEGHILHIWLRPLFLAEKTIAAKLFHLKNTLCLLREVDTEKAISWVEEKFRFRLAKEQKIAVCKSLEEKLHIITGGPGTGKSTITKAILAVHRKLSDNILLAAPTGRAAKRMSEITRQRANTIHSLLEFDFVNGGFKRDKDNPLVCDLLIIDEASMIDTRLMASLLSAVPDEARVIFIGDIDQLPSVGPGNVLRDLIASKVIATTRLFQIFRQGKGSKIVVNAHNINKGVYPELPTDPKENDFVFIEANEPEEILENVIELATKWIPDGFGFDPWLHSQVLSPMKKGIIGTENLNHLLQNRLNPSNKSIERMGRSFRVGDKVMQIRNNYNKKVFNGDIGKILSIDEEMQSIIILFDQNEIEYDFLELDELSLAYAVSIHKYQGSESPCIIIPIHTSHFKLLYRNLLYTGITRGKKLVVLVGSKRAIALAVKNNEVRKRHTGLVDFLLEKDSI